MEQRRLRLGDILDDYCPRERRVTNHAVVAMVGEDVKQTRCGTCDAEHPYKEAREPRRRKKDAPSALYREVLAGMADTDSAPASAGDAAPAAVGPPAIVPPHVDPESDAAELDAASDGQDDEQDGGDDEGVVPNVEEDSDTGDVPAVEEGPVHRRLIRATLPRPDGPLKETRQAPEFTMRQNTGRGQFRGGGHRMHGNGSGNGNGARPHGRRFPGGGHPGAPGRGTTGRGPGGGFRGGNSPQRGGGKKRSR